MKILLVCLFIKYFIILLGIIFFEGLVFDLSLKGIENMIQYLKAPTLILSAELVVANLVLNVLRLGLQNSQLRLTQDTLDLNKFKLIQDKYDDCVRFIRGRYGKAAVQNEAKLFSYLLGADSSQLNGITEESHFDYLSNGLDTCFKSYDTESLEELKLQLIRFVDFRANISDILKKYKDIT